MFKRKHSVWLCFYLVVFIVLINVCLGDVQSDLSQAEQLTEAGQFAEAELLYNSIIFADPNSDEAFTAQQRLVFLYTELGNQTKEDEAFAKLVTDFSEKEGLPSFLLGQLGNRYRELNRCQKARQVYQYLIGQQS